MIKRKQIKYYFFRFAFLLVWCYVIEVNGQNNEALRGAMYQAYIKDSMHLWKDAMLQYSLEVQNSDSLPYMNELLFAKYGYIGFCLAEKKEDEARIVLDDAWEYVKVIEDKYGATAKLCAFKSAFYAYEIGLSKYKALIFGPKAMQQLDKAESIDSTDVYYLVERGNQLFYTPKLFGGDKAEAIAYYSKALFKMKKSKQYYPSWFYLNTLMSLGKCYEYTGDLVQANEVYKSLLSEEPNFKWAKNVLYPEFLERSGLVK